MSETEERGRRPHEGRVAWVTGGSSGIGAKVVELLRVDGAVVGILDLQEPQVDVPWAQCDISDASAVSAACKWLRARTGSADILVNSAGVPSDCPIISMSDEIWQTAIAVNLTGSFNLIRETMPYMIKQKWGRIVSVTTTTAIRVSGGRAAYAASKAGLIALAKVAAVEGAEHGVTSNIVSPGVTETPMTLSAFGDRETLLRMSETSPIANPMKVVLQPIDIATAIRFFTLPEARYITGDLLYVNAGSYMS